MAYIKSNPSGGSIAAAGASPALASGSSGIAGATSGTELDDEALVERICAGESELFETLVLKYQDRIYNLLYRLSGSESEAEDLAQEAFMKAYRSLTGFRRGSQFFTWLYRIALNTGFSRGRQLGRRREHEGASLDAPAKSGAGADEGGTLGETVAAPEVHPGEQMEKEQLRKRVQDGIAQLPEEYRAVILLREMDGLDYDAIGEALAISRAAVKSRLFRARQELAKMLKDLNE